MNIPREKIIQLLDDYQDYICSPHQAETIREIKQIILGWKE